MRLCAVHLKYQLPSVQKTGIFFCSILFISLRFFSVLESLFLSKLVFFFLERKYFSRLAYKCVYLKLFYFDSPNAMCRGGMRFDVSNFNGEIQHFLLFSKPNTYTPALLLTTEFFSFRYFSLHFVVFSHFPVHYAIFLLTSFCC